MRLQKVCDYGNNRTLIYRGKCIVTNIVCDYVSNGVHSDPVYGFSIAHTCTEISDT